MGKSGCYLVVRQFPTRASLGEGGQRERRLGPRPPSRPIYLPVRGSRRFRPPGAETRSLGPPSGWPDWGAGARAEEPGGGSLDLPGPGRRGSRVRSGSARSRAGHRQPSPRRRAPRRAAQAAGRGLPEPAGAPPRPRASWPSPSPRPTPEQPRPSPPSAARVPCRAPRIARCRLRAGRASVLLQLPASQPDRRTDRSTYLPAGVCSGQARSKRKAFRETPTLGREPAQTSLPTAPNNNSKALTTPADS